MASDRFAILLVALTFAFAGGAFISLASYLF
jgi:hypothetical protein